MQPRIRPIVLTLAVIGAGIYLKAGPRRPATGLPPTRPTEGMLFSIGPKGEPGGPCPLKHTGVKADISGFLSRVTVTQEFENPYDEKIGAVYTFPLPQHAAVDDMTILIGDRTVRGKIKRREEARAIYEAARDAGYAAALLDQERPNIFTQSVANIRPKEKVKVTIRYVETLKYEDGAYEFVFPMVVGPRYIPGNPTGKQGGGWAPDTDRVGDASRITPPVTPKGTRAGHDISVEVTLDAGVPINFLRSVTHDVDIQRPSPHQAVLHLKDKAAIPNKDLVLQYDVAGKRMEDALLAHHDAKGGFFTLILQPPDQPRPQEVTPKELVFVLDTSGSMMGFPIEKSKETMRMALDGLNPRDTFNVITFSGDEHILFPQPVPATRENVRYARSFVEGTRGSGGTEMMKAIRAALDPSDKQDHVRIACFLTDGYVGNDMEIIAEVQKHPNARVFAFGIGSAVNRFLLDKMAETGRGEVEYVGLEDDGTAAAKRFYERVRNPLLTDISIDWGGLPVSEIYPTRIPDLFSAKPVIVTGRYNGASKGTIRLRGKMAGRSFEHEVPVTLPAAEPKHDVLATLWARRKIDDLMGQDWMGLQRGNAKADVREAITRLGLDFNLMTQFTSFVAVEETVITEGGRPRRVDVPVEMPNGVSYEGVFGSRGEGRMARAMAPTGARKMMAFGGFRESASQQAAAMPASPAPPPPARLAIADADLSVMKQPLRKLDPSLAAMIGNKTGTVEVRVWLSDNSPQSLKQLKDAGLEVIATPQSARLVVGRIEVGKLTALANLGCVRYVSPKE